MTKLTPEIKGFIEAQIKGSAALKYRELAQVIVRKYGLQISKSTISKRAAALKLKLRRGRKRIVPMGKMPSRSIFLDCAGSFFLKGAELEMGLLAAMNQLLKTSTESAQAIKALKLARQINALLLYAPVFGLKTASDIAGYPYRGLLYLTEQNVLPAHHEFSQAGGPGQQEIVQYLRYLSDQRLLPFIIKEVAKICTEALLVRIDFLGQTFYLDAQCRTVWPDSKVPRFFSATLNKTKGYVKNIFQSPSPRRPLILQTSPGYTFLPPEMFNLIQCFEEAADKSIARIVIADKAGETLSLWRELKPQQKCFFIAPLSPWQYARLQGSQIVKDFKQYRIGLAKESMAVADARINLFNPQLSKNVRVRAALVRREEERVALITNISQREERYIRKIVEEYFSRWPQAKIKTYYDLLEEAYEEALARSQPSLRGARLLRPSLRGAEGDEAISKTGSQQAAQSQTLRLLHPFGVRNDGLSISQGPLDAFRLFLEHLHRYSLSHFFPSEYEAETLESMGEKLYRHCGYLKMRQHCWELFLCPFDQKRLQKDVQIACQRFNQSGVKFPDQKGLRIYL